MSSKRHETFISMIFLLKYLLNLNKVKRNFHLNWNLLQANIAQDLNT